MADVEAPEPRRPRDSVASRVLSAADHGQVPLRTILATVGVVVATGIVLVLAWALRLELILLFVALFFTVLLARPVRALEARGLGRGTATTLVFVAFLIAFCGLAYLFAEPLISHLVTLLGEYTKLAKKAEEGKGWVGSVATKLHIRNWLKDHVPKLKQYLETLVKPIVSLGSAAFTTVVAMVTTAMLTYFLLLDLPKIWGGFLSLLPEERAERVNRVAYEASRGVIGYIVGNITTSVIAGVVMLITLLVCGVPFALVLALWVAMVDLLPIVGALVAGVPTVLLAFLHSLPAGIAVAVVFLVYQQVENHVLNPIIMSRTVRLSKLLILLAVIFFAAIGDKVAGVLGTFVGALIGIPLGSAIQVVIRELWRSAPLTKAKGSGS